MKTKIDLIDIKYYRKSTLFKRELRLFVYGSLDPIIKSLDQKSDCLSPFITLKHFRFFLLRFLKLPSHWIFLIRIDTYLLLLSVVDKQVEA